MRPLKLPSIRNLLSTWRPFDIKETLDLPNKTDKKRISYQIRTNRIPKFDVEQDDLKLAIQFALDEIDPRRESLLSIYREAKRDFHLLSQCQNGVDDVLQQGWGLFNDETGELNEEVTKLFQKKWFEKLMSIFLWNEYEGYKLAEFGLMHLTEKGWEFKDVKEFPMEFVLPERGLILANPTAQTGLPYRPEMQSKEDMIKAAEIVSEWLIECGEPENLGLFAVAAKYTIYKKWGLGDWARSSEKWIDPAIAIKSGTDDQGENDKKAEMARNWGNNQWMLLDSEDDVTLMERRNANGFTITKEMLEYLDKENSKGINGQFATADQKSFVGSSEVQERTQIKRTRRRSRSLFYWINETVIPKLLVINGGDTAYKVVAGHTWKPFWMLEEDDAESTDPEQTDDPKQTNGNTPKNKVKRAGGASKGKHQPLQGNKEVSAGFGLHTELTALYNQVDSSPSGDHRGHSPSGVRNTTSLELISQRMIDRIYDRKLRPGNIDQELTQAQAEEFMKALNEGYDQSLRKVVFASQEHRIRVMLEHNVHVIAAFKNHQNVLDIHELLFDDKGKIKSKSQFLKDIKSVNDDYNINWAGTEYRLAVGQAQMADKYLHYVDRGGSFVYVSMNDGRVRPEHEELHGLTAPVDHPIWDSVLPKNGFGCRCWYRWIREVMEKISESADAFAENMPNLWKNNPGKTGKVLNEYHPYFEVAQKYLKKAQKLFGFKPPVNLDRFNRNLALYETLKDSPDHELLSSFLDSGGFIFRHKAFDKKDFLLNKTAADKLARNGFAVEIREHIHRDGILNPELTISGVVSDLKTPQKIGGIKSAFKNARKQQVDTVVIQLKDSWESEAIIKQVGDGFFYNDSIEVVYLLYKDQIIELDRRSWMDGQWYKIK